MAATIALRCETFRAAHSPSRSSCVPVMPSSGVVAILRARVRPVAVEPGLDALAGRAPFPTRQPTVSPLLSQLDEAPLVDDNGRTDAGVDFGASVEPVPEHVGL